MEEQGDAEEKSVAFIWAVDQQTTPLLCISSSTAIIRFLFYFLPFLLINIRAFFKFNY